MLARTRVAPTSPAWAGVRHLMAACVPTGAKTGVSRLPCGVEKVAARARPLVAAIENSNIAGDYKPGVRATRSVVCRRG